MGGHLDINHKDIHPGAADTGLLVVLFTSLQLGDKAFCFGPVLPKFLLDIELDKCYQSGLTPDLHVSVLAFLRMK